MLIYYQIIDDIIIYEYVCKIVIDDLLHEYQNEGCYFMYTFVRLKTGLFFLPQSDNVDFYQCNVDTLCGISSESINGDYSQFWL